MKTLMIAILLGFTGGSFAQGSEPATTSYLPVPAMIQDLVGNMVDVNSIQHDGPVLFYFWATWCKPSIPFLQHLAEFYEEWREETGVRVLAISIDNKRSSPKVAPFVATKEWPFDVYIDVNQDLKRLCGVNAITHFILYDRTGAEVWNHVGCYYGDEEEILEEITKLAN